MLPLSICEKKIWGNSNYEFLQLKTFTVLAWFTTFELAVKRAGWGGGAGWGGETGNWKLFNGAKGTVALSNSLKKIASPYICVRLERWGSETNDRAPCTLTKKPVFMRRKKRKKERKKKRKERPLALTKIYFFLYCYWKSEKRKKKKTFSIRSPRGGTRWIYHVPGK